MDAQKKIGMDQDVGTALPVSGSRLACIRPELSRWLRCWLLDLDKLRKTEWESIKLARHLCAGLAPD
jgi:hypothetical protein